MNTNKRHPESGKKGRKSRDSLFSLILSTVFLAILINVITGFFGIPEDWFKNWYWLLVLGLLVLISLGLIWFSIIRDDRFIGRDETDIELLLTYRVSGSGKNIHLIERTSYSVTAEANEAWKRVWHNSGFQLQKPLNIADFGKVKQAVLPQHFDLVRYLLFHYLDEFKEKSRDYKILPGIQDLGITMKALDCENWPDKLKENLYLVSRKIKGFSFPDGAHLLFFNEGPVLFEINWKPSDWDFTQKIPLIRRWTPGGKISFAWLGPVDNVRTFDRKYEEMTKRLHKQVEGDLSDPERGVYVFRTRLKILIETRWNFLPIVDLFQDWALNLTYSLQQKMDYGCWWDYMIQRGIADLDWKVGWMEKKGEPSLAERLRRMDERLAKLEDKLFAEYLEQGDTTDAWMGGVSNEKEILNNEDYDEKIFPAEPQEDLGDETLSV